MVVISFCLDCRANICDKCKEKRLHRGHELVPRTDPRVAGFRRFVKQQCKIHSGYYYITFCKKCKVPCCSICISKKHHEHSFSEIEDAAEEAKEDLTACLETLEQKTLPVSNAILKGLSDRIIEYNKAAEDAIGKSKRRFQMFREQIEREEKEWMQKLHELKTRDLTELEKNKRDLFLKIKRTTDLIQSCKSTLADADDVALLMFNKKRIDITTLESGVIPLPPFIQYHPTDYKLPAVGDLIGRITLRNKREIGEAPVEEAPPKPVFNPNSIEIKLLKVINNIRAHTLVHAGQNEAWINDQLKKTIHVFDENMKKTKAFKFDFAIEDMTLASPKYLLASDWDGQCIKQISLSGKCSAILSTTPLNPSGLCVNDKQQIVVGVGSYSGTPLIKLVVYDAKRLNVIQEISKDDSGKNLFTERIQRVKQQSNGNYLISSSSKVICVGRDGKFKWEHKESKSLGDSNEVFSTACDKYDNILVAGYANQKVQLLNSDGKIIKTILTRKEGILCPWSLSLDKYGYLWIGQQNSVRVMQYIK